MDTELCLGALSDALASSAGRQPKIFNTEQGSQFTGEQWTGQLEEPGIAVSMDGKGRWMDNVFIERLWRSVKYEEIDLREHATLPELRAGLEEWFCRYNRWRPHQALGNRTPEEVHRVDELKARNPALGKGTAASDERIHPQCPAKGDMAQQTFVIQ